MTRTGATSQVLLYVCSVLLGLENAWAGAAATARPTPARSQRDQIKVVSRIDSRLWRAKDDQGSLWDRRSHADDGTVAGAALTGGGGSRRCQRCARECQTGLREHRGCAGEASSDPGSR